MAVTCDQLVGYSESINLHAGELECRTAIGRAYYAIYHHSLQWESALSELGTGAGEGGGIHQQLINRLKTPSSKCGVDLGFKSRSLAYRLIQLKIVRTKADYDLQGSVSIEEAANACSEARSILGAFPLT
jgi:hypothetical protein